MTKLFVRSHLDYGDIFHGQPSSESFYQKIESLQYEACLAITGTISGIPRNKLYKKLSFESLKSVLYKILQFEIPKYLLKIIPLRSHKDNARSSDLLMTFCFRTESLK